MALSKGFFSEMSLHKEGTIRNEKLRIGLFDKAFDFAISELVLKLGKISIIREEFKYQSFKARISSILFGANGFGWRYTEHKLK